MPHTTTHAPWSLLEKGAGTFEGDEEMPPAPWAPEGMKARGRTVARLIHGGRGLASDYVQWVEGEVATEAHTVIRYEEPTDDFVMHFFPSTGDGPSVMRGHRDGNALVFEGDGPAGPMRQTFLYGDDRLEVLAESPPEDGSGWTLLHRGEYRRQPDAPEADGPTGSTSPGAAANVEAAPFAPPPGSIAWQDLTVEDAPAVRSFYRAVVGWEVREVDMGGYADYEMRRPGGEAVAGVCHARGSNADLPPLWLLYVVVEELDAALDAARSHGGEVVSGPREMGPDRMAVVRDPAGAVLALYQKG